MTIKELYEWAKSMELENSILTLNYKCDDYWYNYNDYIKLNNLTIDDYNNIVIEIDA